MDHRCKTSRLLCGCVAAIALAGVGCERWLSNEPVVALDQTNVGVAPTREAAELRGGATLWSQNCMRCHNLRNPRERNDREWEVIVHHMRVRAGLTAEEHRLILRFLQSAN